MISEDEFRALIADDLASKLEYDRMKYDEPTERTDPSGASDEQIAALERMLGRPLPESYRVFLRIRNGFQFFDGESSILSVEEHAADWVRRECAEKSEMFTEFWPENPLAQGAIPILLGEDSNAMVLFEVDHDTGVQLFVEYDIVEKMDEYPSLDAYIKDHLEVLRDMIKDETAGLAL